VTQVTTLVLARLLVPGDFGLVALASLILESVRYLTTFGIGPAVIVSPDLDARARGCALTLMAAFGIGSTLVIAAVAPVAAAVFDAPRLAAVLGVLALTRTFDGLAAFYDALLRARLEFRPRFVAFVLQSAVYAVLSIALAAVGAGVWSIVAGQLGSYVVLVAALIAMTRDRPRPVYDRDVCRRLLARGRGFVAQGVFSFLQQNADYIAVGRVLGAAPLGLYSMAYRLGETPYNAVGDPVAQVTFPGFARMRARGEDVGPTFLAMIRVVALVTVPLGLVLSGTARPFIEAVLGSHWRAMTGPLAVLGVWGALRPLQMMFGWLLNSVGESRIVGRVSGAFLVVLVPATIAAAAAGGVTAVAWLMVVDLLAFLAALSALTARRVGVTVREQWAAVQPVVIAGVPTWAAAHAVAGIADATGAGPALVLAVAASGAVYLATLRLWAPDVVSFAVRQIRTALGRALHPTQPIGEHA
jgi:PST family polysaccharide transporter